MKIGFVLEPYEEANASGMGYLIRELAIHLQKADPNHEYFFYSAKKPREDILPGNFTHVQIPRGGLGKLWWFFAHHPKVDVLLFVAPLLPLLISSKVKAVILCQELSSQNIRPGSIYARFLAFVRDQVLMPISVKRAQVIVVPSHSTEQDVLTHYPSSQGKIRIVPDGFQDMSRFAARAVPPSSAVTPYFFFTGKVKSRKNVHGIVSAFIRFKERTNSSVQLVIGGSYGGAYHAALLSELKAHNLENSVHFVGYVSPEELCGYYEHALAFVFPSLSEGFGMPILEAMSLGIPVVTSSISSMGEIAGDAAVLTDPYSIETMSVDFERIATDDALREVLIARGKNRAKEFSWERTGREYHAVLAEL